MTPDEPKPTVGADWPRLTTMIALIEDNETIGPRTRAAVCELLRAIHSGQLVVVPREPTEEMMRALEFTPCGDDLDGTCKAVWKPCYDAMLAAAPSVALEAPLNDEPYLRTPGED